MIIFDEEVSVYNGMVKVVEVLMVCNECFDYCLVGELLSIEVVGDVVKNGCCGLLICNFIIYGV